MPILRYAIYPASSNSWEKSVFFLGYYSGTSRATPLTAELCKSCGSWRTSHDWGARICPERLLIPCSSAIKTARSCCTVQPRWTGRASLTCDKHQPLIHSQIQSPRRRLRHVILVYTHDWQPSLYSKSFSTRFLSSPQPQVCVILFFTLP